MATSSPSALALGDHTFTADDITFKYSVAGSGPVLVAQAPGWGPGASYMVNGWSQLTSHFTVVFFTPRGTPPSTRPANESDMSTAVMADDLEALRLHLDVPSFRLMGHSSGGSISLGYAEDYPTRVSHLVMVDNDLKGYKDPDGTWDKFVAARKDHPIYGPALKTFYGLVSRQIKLDTDEEFTAAVSDFIPYYMADPTKASLFVETLDDPLCIWAYDAMAKADKESKGQVEALANVKAKTLVVWGTEDAICPVSLGRKTAEGIQGAKLAVIEDAGHFSWIEKPEEFWGAVLPFLKE